MKKTFLLILFVSVLLYSCGKKENIDREVLAHTYVELLIAEQQYLEKPDSLEIAKREVFSKYNLNEEEYISGLENYQSKKEKWDLFFVSAQTYLDSLKAENAPD